MFRPLWNECCRKPHSLPPATKSGQHCSHILCPEIVAFLAQCKNNRAARLQCSEQDLWQRLTFNWCHLKDFSSDRKTNPASAKAQHFLSFNSLLVLSRTVVMAKFSLLKPHYIYTQPVSRIQVTAQVPSQWCGVPFPQRELLSWCWRPLPTELGAPGGLCWEAAAVLPPSFGLALFFQGVYGNVGPQMQRMRAGQIYKM